MEESPETSKEQEAAAGQAGGAAPVDPSGTEPPSAAMAALSVDIEAKTTSMEVDLDAAGQADSERSNARGKGVCPEGGAAGQAGGSPEYRAA